VPNAEKLEWKDGPMPPERGRPKIRVQATSALSIWSAETRFASARRFTAVKLVPLEIFGSKPYNLLENRLCSRGYQSQIDGLWRFAAPLSFFLASPSTRGPIVGLRLKKEIDMPIGTVKFFNADKGYGFIAPEGGGNDAFVHISAVERAGMRTLDKEQRVSYELETDNRGKTSAVNLSAA
jgi:CspA family cold shock protein